MIDVKRVKKIIDIRVFSNVRGKKISSTKKKVNKKIHFFKKEGLKPSEAAKKLQLHYGDSAPNISIISCWLSRFAAYRESLEDVVY